jgi:hypothetical protein
MLVKSSGLIFLLVSAAALPGQTASADYFPLTTGNSWTYRETGRFAAGDAPLGAIYVGAVERAGNRDYHRVNFFGRSLLLREDSGGAVFRFNANTGVEEPWVELGAPEGTSFEAHMDNCTPRGRTESRAATVSTPAGEFTHALHLVFQPACADAGVTQQYWGEGVGLLVHEETSFAGARRFELVSHQPARIAAPEVAFTMGLDAPHYLVGSTVRVRLTLESTHPDPIPLRFPSGQSVDLKLYNETGGLVYTWSDGRAFTQVYREELFGPGVRTYELTAPLEKLPPGRYRARGYLTTDPVEYAAESAFRIVEVSHSVADSRERRVRAVRIR